MDSWGFFVFALVFLAFIFAVLFAIIGTDAVPSEKTAVKAEREPASVAGVFFQGGKEIVRGNTEKNQVIFTFDGGDTDQSAEKILNVLEKHKVKGTFFLTGKFVENYPELVKRIAAQGEEIFSHTYDHKDLETLSDGEITAELTMMETVLGNTVHISPKPFFRAPYGSRDGGFFPWRKKPDISRSIGPWTRSIGKSRRAGRRRKWRTGSFLIFRRERFFSCISGTIFPAKCWTMFLRRSNREGIKSFP